MALAESPKMPSHSSPLSTVPGDALLIVDVQNDFLPAGRLPVPAGDMVLSPLAGWITRFANAGLPIFATRDWHPPDHCSFTSQGGSWPPHCIAGTVGAAFPQGLPLPAAVQVIDKATLPGVEAYSGFAGTDLDSRLRAAGVCRLFVGGLATDYCVLNTVLDALGLGYKVMLLPAGVRAVDVHPGDGDRALAAMMAAGAVLLKEDQP
jgi:nicotinamidase/pyrazinamidase